MKKKLLTVISIVLTLVMFFNCALCVNASESPSPVIYTSKTGKYTAEKISHPSKGLGETDGIVDYLGDAAVAGMDEGQGDRAQNYAWSAVYYGNAVYVSTNYNSLGLTLEFMDTVLGYDYEPEEMTAQLNTFYNGSFFTGEPDGAKTGGVLTKIDLDTYEVTVLMSKSKDGNNVQLRNACIFKDKLYFCGAVNGLPKIIEVDPANNDKCTIIYEGISAKDYYTAYLAGISPSIRGLTPYGDYLIISMTTLTGTEILISKDPSKGQDAFTKIADQNDLFDYPAFRFQDSIYGGAIWEMAVYNDKVYVSICTGRPENMPDDNTMQSFAIVCGEMGSDFTDWTWTPVVGNKADGAKYTFGIDPERTRAGAGVLCVYDGYLYIGEYNDEEIPMEHILFKADFAFMNANLKQSVSLYRMDKDENIELVVGDPTAMYPNGGISGLGSGFGRHENQYIWRMEVHNGKLYVGTFDTSSLLQPVAQFVNGDLATMSVKDWKSLLTYLKTFVDIRMSKEGSEEDKEGMNLKYLFDNFDIAKLAEMFKGLDLEGIKNIAVKGKQMKESIAEISKVIGGVLECSKYLAKATRGFDLYVTVDGESFDTITIDGFGDPYNHGCRSFASTDKGLMVGTANPFYATQVWLLNEDESVTDKWEPAKTDIEIIWEKFINFIKNAIETIIENINYFLGK